MADELNPPRAKGRWDNVKAPSGFMTPRGTTPPIPSQSESNKAMEDEKEKIAKWTEAQRRKFKKP